ncbi:MAG: D-glycero-beta-D-manno-heptose 1-phosphate adenylyltransferase, partial [Bacteroidia bacterium]|nr:D-glycero-beta-D-manno-heptose 1-phosphate adenylyltransferase [Bacteroidia bacterium]
TNGCFDLIHLGHIDYLSKASDLGNRLIIGLNTDSSVSKLKGEHRPIKDEHSRATILASFSFIDAVVLFNEDTPLTLIEEIKPDILVKGGDYKSEEIVGHDSVKENKGEVVILDFIEGYSSSKIEEKIKSDTKS